MKSFFSQAEEDKIKRKSIRKRLYTIIFQTNTLEGKRFDLILMAFIVFSILILFIESLPNLSPGWRFAFKITEWFLSSIFVIEYILRIWISPNRKKYIFSAWGIVDFLSILPILFLPFHETAHFLRMIRIVRLIRLFYIFKLNRFTLEAYSLYHSLVASLYKIAVFMFFVVILAIVMGGLMFVVEGEEHGFKSIPQSIYWAIVTITTVGFGDITPNTDLGKFLAAIMMLLGYAIIAVPTGIVSAEIVRQGNGHHQRKRNQETTCSKCKHANSTDSKFCNQCGEKLEESNQ